MTIVRHAARPGPTPGAETDTPCAFNAAPPQSVSAPGVVTERSTGGAPATPDLRSAAAPRAPHDRRRHVVTWSQEAIIDALQRWAAEHGRAPSSEDWYKGDRDRPNMKVVVAAFGSFAAGRDAAGLTFRRKNHAGDWTRREVVDAVTRWVFLHGRLPRREQWDRPPEGFPSTHRVETLFGTWTGAVVAAGYRPVRMKKSFESYRGIMGNVARQAAA